MRVHFGSGDAHRCVGYTGVGMNNPRTRVGDVMGNIGPFSVYVSTPLTCGEASRM